MGSIGLLRKRKRRRLLRRRRVGAAQKSSYLVHLGTQALELARGSLRHPADERAYSKMTRVTSRLLGWSPLLFVCFLTYKALYCYVRLPMSVHISVETKNPPGSRVDVDHPCFRMTLDRSTIYYYYLMYFVLPCLATFFT